tara:strand:+ start:223 stop:765 length:543 start_codon:yes stop_codon:yes gene_type:complete
MFRKYSSVTLIIFFLIGCSDATSVDKTETTESTLPEPTYTYLRCEDKDESWKDDPWVEREHWANLVLKIDSDSETVFHNGPNYQWRKTSNRSWNTSEIAVLDYGYSNVDFETITINRESLNVIRAIGWDISRRGKYWKYGCEMMNELESTSYEEMFAKSREELLRANKEKEEEQKKKNKI